MKKKLVFIFLLFYLFGSSQNNYWQQEVNYKMEIDFDIKSHRFIGEQELVYQNNSPDTLTKVFYHLYLNAFQPGSMMDVRSRTISDPDARVGNRIFGLTDDQIGYHNIHWLKMNGENTNFEINGTIMEVVLPKPILPGKKVTFEMKFESQVPIQIRRTGRDNKEGVAYTMTQWYPKMAEYDKEGWHANPYIGREFHGVWGCFDVTINIDASFVIGGTGTLQNPKDIGYGYSKKSINHEKGTRLSWHFIAKNVHDFAWAADPEFIHDQVEVKNGPTLHFFYQPDTLKENWKGVQPFMVKLFEIMNDTFGRYPYDHYSFIQGGDGGMEYPMCTMVTSHNSLGGLVSVCTHESIHSWYQGALATNEAKYSWMDEGFTQFGQYYVLDKLYKRSSTNPFKRIYRSYYALVNRGMQEPLTTHSDHYQRNSTYSVSSYHKGAVFLYQLSYVIGEKAFFEGMQRYFNEWKFKHPTPTDFKRVMEKVSGLELDWYFEHWVGTTNTVDYAIQQVVPSGDSTKITLERIGKIPMPLDVHVILKGGEREKYYIPNRMMRGEKNEEQSDFKTIEKEDWPWVYPEYELMLNYPIDQIMTIEIDNSQRMADVDRSNNSYPSKSNVRFIPSEK